MISVINFVVDDDSGEVNHGLEAVICFTSPPGDALALFEFAEQVFDQAATFVYCGVVEDWNQLTSSAQSPSVWYDLYAKQLDQGSRDDSLGKSATAV